MTACNLQPAQKTALSRDPEITVPASNFFKEFIFLMTNILKLAIKTVLLAAVASAAFAQQDSSPSPAPGGEVKTYTGVISDSMCTSKHMLKHMNAANDAECVRKCVKDGFDYVLVVGDDYLVLKGKPEEFDKYAGQKVTVKGTVKKDELTAESVTPAKTAAPSKPAATKKKGNS